MPILASSYPGPPFYMLNGQLETLIPYSWSYKEGPPYERERIILPDGDFLDLDWVKNESEYLVILTHGIVGDSYRDYIRRAAHFFSIRNWDVLAWNCRSCSGEMNKNFRLYYHGATDDLEQVVHHACQGKKYKKIFLVGYSMGGSMTLKYLGVKGGDLPGNIGGGIAFCTPFNLEVAARQMDLKRNYLYRRAFINEIMEKLEAKAQQFPGKLDLSLFKQVKNWRDFDAFFTAKVNGYDDVDRFYEDGSAENFLPGIQVPVLMVNSLNDPIIPKSIAPKAICNQQDHLYLELPKRGGHVGFVLSGESFTWMDYRTWDFIREYV